MQDFKIVINNEIEKNINKKTFLPLCNIWDQIFFTEFDFLTYKQTNKQNYRFFKELRELKESGAWINKNKNEKQIMNFLREGKLYI